MEQSYGKLKEAKSIYQKLLNLDPYYIETYYRIYLLNSDSLKEEYETQYLETISEQLDNDVIKEINELNQNIDNDNDNENEKKNLKKYDFSLINDELLEKYAVDKLP